MEMRQKSENNCHIFISTCVVKRIQRGLKCQYFQQNFISGLQSSSKSFSKCFEILDRSLLKVSSSLPVVVGLKAALSSMMAGLKAAKGGKLLELAALDLDVDPL